MRQLATCYAFKIPRMNQIRKYRALYNGQTEKQLRIRYNVPIPIFTGMIDTLQADLNDGLILKFSESDPADWKAVKKVNAALQKESTSMRPGAMWDHKFRMARQENIFSGRGYLKHNASNQYGFETSLTAPTFDSMFFEPAGGGQLENHLFCGESDIWKTASELQDRAGNDFDARQVKKLLAFSGSTYKQSSFWNNYDFANRFLSLGLTPDSNNYVGETMFNFVEWCQTYKGQRWYILFEAFTGTWVKFEKLTDIHSSGYYPWMSFASHEDSKNFASKSFADDLYPLAKAMTDLFNEDMENKKRRGSNARLYDKDMFPDVAKLDEAQMGRDRLVPVDTKNGTRRIDQGIYEFKTPEITGTVDALNYLEALAGRNFGVNDLQKGDAGKDAKVGVTMLESQQISERLSFESQPFIEVGQQLGMRFFGALKDYLREPLSIKILGEDGYQWDTLQRIDLDVKRDFEITVTSQSKENKTNELLHQKKMAALLAVRDKPVLNKGVNGKLIDEYILRDAGLDELEIALILDPRSHADKTTIAETSAAIQDIMQGRVPKVNYNATAYFLQTLLDFVKTHQDDKKIKGKLQIFLDYINKHEPIAIENETRRAVSDAQALTAGSLMARQENGGQPVPGKPMMPQPPQPQSLEQPVQQPALEMQPQ